MAGRVPVCCVVGFPLGAMDTASKAFEAKTAVENGASEVDMVINIGWLKNKQYDDVRNDIAAVKAAVGDKVLKVIIETCLLTEEEKIKMCNDLVFQIYEMTPAEEVPEAEKTEEKEDEE